MRTFYCQGFKVDPKVRKLVAAVVRLANDEGISVKALGEDLGFHHLRAWRLVKKALKDEFLVNQENRKGAPARLVVGDPIPPDGAVLPLPEKIFCSHPPENDENVKTDGESQVNAMGSRFHPPMKTPENDDGKAPGFHHDEAVFTTFSPPYENDNLSETQEKDAAFSRFHGLQGDKEESLFDTRTGDL